MNINFFCFIIQMLVGAFCFRMNEWLTTIPLTKNKVCHTQACTIYSYQRVNTELRIALNTILPASFKKTEIFSNKLSRFCSTLKIFLVIKRDTFRELLSFLPSLLRSIIFWRKRNEERENLFDYCLFICMQQQQHICLAPWHVKKAVLSR